LFEEIAQQADRAQERYFMRASVSDNEHGYNVLNTKDCRGLKEEARSFTRARDPKVSVNISHTVKAEKLVYCMQILPLNK